MLTTVYKAGKRQLSYNVVSVENAEKETLKRWREEGYDEVDPLETPFDLFLQELLMQFEPAICVTVTRGWGGAHGFIWFDWGCLTVREDGVSRIYIDEAVNNVSVNIC